MLESKFCSNMLFRYFPEWVGDCPGVIIRLNSVQLKLQLPAGTELGNKNLLLCNFTYPSKNIFFKCCQFGFTPYSNKVFLDATKGVIFSVKLGHFGINRLQKFEFVPYF